MYNIIIYAFKKLSRNRFLFLILIILPQILFFILVDLVRASTSSLVFRYQMITIQGGILFLIFLLSNKVQSGKLLYSGLFIGIILFGFVSIYQDSQKRCWGKTYICQETVNTAKIISGAHKPLLILGATKDNPENVISLTLLYECEYDNLDIMIVYPPVENIEELVMQENYSDVFVRHNSDPIISYLKSQFGERMDSLEIEGILPMWKIRN